MTTTSLSHYDLTQAGWICIHFDTTEVWRARKQESYFEFFETDHIRNKYAIFSVPNGYDFFFLNSRDATEFALRWRQCLTSLELT